MHLTNTMKNNDCVVSYVACLSLVKVDLYLEEVNLTVITVDKIAKNVFIKYL
jgi:hypothetical protein